MQSCKSKFLLTWLMGCGLIVGTPGCVSSDGACLAGDELVDGRCQSTTPGQPAGDNQSDETETADDIGTSGTDTSDTSTAETEDTTNPDDEETSDPSGSGDGTTDGVPDDSAVIGCTREQAINYQPDATEDDGSCEFMVTFSVDMRYVALDDDDVVYLNGSMNDWCGDCEPMSDDDGDGIWSLYLPMTANLYEYRFTINGWEYQEIFEIGGACDYLPDDEFANRGFQVISDPVVLATPCYESCVACAEPVLGCTDVDAANFTEGATSDDGSCLYGVTFAVDTRYAGLLDGDVIYLNGAMNDWCGDCNPMADDDGDAVWTLTLDLSPATYEYRYTVNGWASQEEIPLNSPCDYVPGDEYLSRGFELVTEPIDLSTEPVCYSECNVCSEEVIDGCTDAAATNYDVTAALDDGSCTYDVTFSVDMSTASLSEGDVVHINGGFNGWCGDCTAMADDDADGVWEATLTLAPGQHEYRFTINGWAQAEDIGVDSVCDYTSGDEHANRGFELGQAPLVLETPCYAACTGCL